MARGTGAVRANKPAGRKRRKIVPRDVFEAEEGGAAEEQAAGRRYDKVDDYQYELPSDFEDEEIDEESAFTAEDEAKYAGWFEGSSGGGGGLFGGAASGSESEGDPLEEDGEEEEEEGSEASGEAGPGDEGDAAVEAFLESGGSSDSEGGGSSSGAEDGDEAQLEPEAAQRLLADLSAARPARQGRRREVLTEALPESEFNLQPGAEELRVADLVEGLGEKLRRKLGSSWKALKKLDGPEGPRVQPPLPGPIRDRKLRQAGYEEASRQVSRWQPLVKANREAPTLVFTSGAENLPRTNSVAALASKFEPQSGMEAEVAALLKEAKADGASAVQAAEEALLANEDSEAARARAGQLAKLRSLLSYHEVKLKRLAKIKSKDFHRRENRAARAKARKAGELGEEGFLRLQAEEAELARAKERVSLKHRSTNRWARRALKRGLTVMDAGTKEAIAEQLRLGQELRRRVEAPEGGASGEDDTDAGSDSSASDGEAAGGGGADGEGRGGQEAEGDAGERKRRRRAAARLREAAADILEGDPGGAPRGMEGASSSLLRLPFMQRALQRQQQAAQDQAKATLEALEEEERRAGRAPGPSLLEGVPVVDDDDEGENPFSAAVAAASRPPAQAMDSDDEDAEPRPATDSGSDSDPDEGLARIARQPRPPQPGRGARRAAATGAGLAQQHAAVHGSPEPSSGAEPQQEAAAVSVMGSASGAAGASSGDQSMVSGQAGPLARRAVAEGGLSAEAPQSAPASQPEPAPEATPPPQKAAGARAAAPGARGGSGSASARKRVSFAAQLHQPPSVFPQGASTPPSALKKPSGPKGRSSPALRAAVPSPAGGEASPGSAGQGAAAQGQGQQKAAASGLEALLSKLAHPQSSAREWLTGGPVSMDTASPETPASAPQGTAKGKAKGKGKGKKRGMAALAGDAAAAPASVPDATAGSQPAAGPPSAAAASVAQQGGGQAAFVPAAAFQGARPGYAFRRGPKGQGYYLQQQQAATSASPPGRGPAGDGGGEGAPPGAKRKAGAQQRKGKRRRGAAGEQEASAGGEVQEATAAGAAGPPGASPAPVGTVTLSDSEGEQEGDDPAMSQPSPSPGQQVVAGMTQRELIAAAFAGDDVLEEFAAEKAAEEGEEAPSGKGPSVLPGWGAWAGSQRTPRWMQVAAEKAARKRAAALAGRKDAALPTVLISERWDKKGAKYGVAAPPFPYASREEYGRTLRQPLGRDFNTVAAHREMVRPPVVKQAGVLIAPLAYSEAAAKAAAGQPQDLGQRSRVHVVAGGVLKRSRRRG